MFARTVLIVSLLYAAAGNSSCNAGSCPLSWRGDGFCDVSCMTLACGYDSAGASSDCDAACAAKGCGVRTDSDPACRAECNIAECKWDNSSCGVCASGCTSDILGNGVCDSLCNVPLCNYDAGDCGTCASGCYDNMLGNRTCNTECLNAACQNDKGDCDWTLCASGCYPYLVNNGVCDAACHLSACGWDGKDCDCTPGCTTDLLSNSFCDGVCSVRECGFDAGLCGNCAAGCFTKMIGDRICDSQCNTKECRYDGLDCGCAPLCDYKDLGSCKAECLVADCNYDNFSGYSSCSDTKLQRVAFLYSLINRNFTAPYDFSALCTATSTCTAASWLNAQTTCSTRCNVAGCAYSQGNCLAASPCVQPPNCDTCELASIPGGCFNCTSGYYRFYTSCVAVCPIGFALHSLVPSLCYPQSDQSTPDSPFVIYVQNTTNALGTGAYGNPLDSLADALDAVSKQYTVIYLMTGYHTLTKCLFAPYVITMGQSAPAKSLIYSGNLTISGFDCNIDQNSPKSPLCASTRPRLVFNNLNPVSVVIRGNVTFRWVELWGGTTLVAGCTTDLCTFCPRVITSATGSFSDDRGMDLQSGSFAPAAACAPFLTQRFISLDAGASLTLASVSFSNFKQGFRSLIYFTDGNVTVAGTDFTNVTIGMYVKPAYVSTSQVFFDSVIVQENPTGKSFVNASLVLDFVNVLLLNNGYEYNVNLSYGGFLSVQALRLISLNSIQFSYCLCPRSSLITVGNFLFFLLKNSTFDTVYAGMFLVRLVPNVLLTDPAEGAMKHAIIKETFFGRCAVALPGSSSSGMMVSVYMLNSLMNIILDGITFTETYSQSALLYVLKVTALTASEMNGSVVTSRVAGQLVSTPIARRTTRVSNLTISNSVVAVAAASGGLLNLGVLANINLTALTVTNSGDAKGTESVNTKTLAYFVQTKAGYLSKLAGGLTYTPCSYPILLRSLYNLNASAVWIRDTGCRSSGTGGVATTGTHAGDFIMTNATFLRLSGQSTTTGVCLHVQSQGAIYLSSISADGISASKSGCVRLSTSQAILISHLAVSNSKSDAGQLQLVSVQNFTLSYCTFFNIASSKEAGVSVIPIAGLANAFMRVEKSSFVQTSGLMGTGIYITGDGISVTPITLQIEDCEFRENSATTRGSGIMLDSSNSIGPNSYIRSCALINNTVNEAVLFFGYQRGTIELSKVLCRWSRIDASSASLTTVGCILGEFKSTEGEQPVVAIAHSAFEDNQGVAMISINSATGRALLVSYNNTFRRNSGRAIFLDSAQMTDSNSLIALNGRVGFYLSGESVCNVSESSFTHNLGKLSGALYLSGGSTGNVQSCLFLNNSAESGNGAIYVEQSSLLTVAGSVFRKNAASDRGAAISLFGSSVNNEVSDSVFEENQNDNGGTILALSSSLLLSNVTFRGNIGIFAPGLLSYFSIVTIWHAVFADQSSESGSFIYASVGSSTFVSDSQFANGAASAEGGAVYLQSSNFSMSSSTFYNISAHRGALLFATSGSNFSLKQCRGELSIAKVVQGGSIYTTESSAIIEDFILISFHNNAIISLNQKLLNVTRSVLADGSGKEGAGIYCSECALMEVRHTTFQNLTADIGGAISAEMQQGTTQYVFFNCSFANNTAKEAGAVQLVDVSADFRSCDFFYNSATTSSGGALCLHCADLNCAVYVTSCAFHRNTASVQGGGIYWEHVKPILTSSSFSEGQATYGRDIASFAVTLSIKAVTGNATLDSFGMSSDSVPIEASLHAAASGQNVDNVVTVALLDHYGQIVTIENKDTASISAPADNENTIGSTSATALNGTFTFSNFGVSARPGTVATVYARAGSIGASGQVSGNFTDRVAFRVEMRPCAMGESQVGLDCILCPEGRYSFNPKENCQECLSEAICYGNYTMAPKKGYWRANIYTPRFYECPNHDACIGSPTPPDPISMRGDCLLGYYGNLCNGCLSGYSRQNQNECLLCPSLIVNTVRMGGITIGVVVALVVIVRTAINSAKKQRSYYSIFIKIMLNYLQLVMLTAAFQMRWPGYMKELFKVQQSAGNVTEQIFAVDCFFNNGGRDAQAVAVRMKLLGIALMPLIVVGLSLLVWLPVTLAKRRVTYLKNELVTTVVVCFFLIHPSIVKFMFSFMYCRELEQGEYWMNDYLNIPCWDFIHYRYVFIVVLPSIAAWGVGVPMLCLLVLYRNKNRLSLLELKLRLGFVYNGYEFSKYYWEFVILYRKILIITVAVFLTNVSTSIQALTVMMLLIGAFSLQMKHKPFAISEMNDLELRGILVSAVTIYCGLYYMTNDLDEFSQVIMFTIVVVINGYFLALWSVRVFHAGFQVLKRRCPWILKCFGSTTYKVQQAPGLVSAKIGSSVSRSQNDSALIDGESIDVSRFYDSESLNESNIRRRPRLISEPRMVVPDNTPGSGSIPHSPE